MGVISELPIQTFESSFATGQDIENALINASNQEGACGLLVSVLTHELRDATVLIGSDSLGNETHEWPFRLSQQYATAFPAYTVEYYLWDVSNKQFPASPDIIQSGTGSYTLRIYNGAVGGSRPDYMLGERFNNFAVGKQADLVICNYGHNIAEDSVTDSYLNSLYCKFIEFMGSVMTMNPGAGGIIIGQNPQETNEKMRRVRDAAQQVSGVMQCDFVDVYALFEAQGRANSLYASGDVVHPSYDGQTLFVNAIWARHQTGKHRAALSPFSVRGQNLIPDAVSTFSAWNGTGLPTDILRSGNAALSQDTTNVDREDFSLKINSASAGAGNTFIQYTLTAKQRRQVLGKRLFAVMRCFRPLAATPITSGKVEIFINGSTRIETAEHNNLPIGGFHYRLICATIPATASDVKLNFYADDGSTDAQVSISAIGAFIGELPGYL